MHGGGKLVWMARVESEGVWLTPEEVAAQLGVSLEAVQQYMAAGKFEVDRSGEAPRVWWHHGEIDPDAKIAPHVIDQPRWLIPTVIGTLAALFFIAVIMLLISAATR